MITKLSMTLQDFNPFIQALHMYLFVKIYIILKAHDLYTPKPFHIITHHASISSQCPAWFSQKHFVKTDAIISYLSLNLEYGRPKMTKSETWTPNISVSYHYHLEGSGAEGMREIFVIHAGYKSVFRWVIRNT